MKNVKTIIFIIALLLSRGLFAIALENVKVVDVYDVDTFYIDIEGISPIFGERLPIRINGIDGPEIRGKCEQEKALARRARGYLKAKISLAKDVSLYNVKRGKYFRLIADVYIDGKNINNYLVDMGVVVPYHGGERINWCKYLRGK